MTRTWALTLMVLMLGCDRETAVSQPQAQAQRSALEAPALSPTRLLRRVYLTLRGNEPNPSDYQRALDAADAGTFETLLQSEVDAALASTDFYEQMVSYGHDYLRIGDYKRGSVEGGSSAPFKGSMAAQLTACPAGTVHAGKLGHFFDGSINNGDPSSLCDSAAAPVASVEPWWAPGTQVQVIGRASNASAMQGTTACSSLNCGETSCQLAGPTCGCGPNLLYCFLYREDRPGYQYPQPYESNPNLPNSLRRLVWEEPARLFAHLIANDEPFSDLVAGSYTVAPRRLQHIYVRWGRMNPANGTALDQSTWWRTATESWERVEVSARQPNLLSERNYKFDPRTDPGSPRGYGAAGVLTMLGPNSWFPRERVRAARWLETFACRVFSAPDPAVVFTPPFSNDPKRQGPCQYCHTTIDPAAIHFKRLEIEDEQAYHGQGHANLGGVGGWQWKLQSQVSFPDVNSPGGVYWRQPYGRWNVSFIANTFLTPVTPSQLAADPDTRFLDFLPPGEELFGRQSDGTIGPLGFGKLLVDSGEFDRCAANRLYERFMGRRLDVTREAATEAALVQQFLSGGRKVKPFIRALVLSQAFRRGL